MGERETGKGSKGRMMQRPMKGKKKLPKKQPGSGTNCESGEKTS